MVSRPEATEPGCALCSGIHQVRYDRAAESRPSPFCSACGREPPMVMVAAVPWSEKDFNHPRNAHHQAGEP